MSIAEITVTQDARKRPPATDSGPWTDWQPLWEAGGPHALQETHSPTEAVTLRQGAERRLWQSQRRIVDARLWATLEGRRQDAALQIAHAFEAMSRGLGYTLSNWERLPGARSHNNASEAHARLVGDYAEWAKRCALAKISHAMVLDILVFGKGLKQSDGERRMRKGSARKNLLKGLEIYCHLKGWRV